MKIDGISTTVFVIFAVLGIFSLGWAIVEHVEINQLLASSHVMVGRIEGGYAITQYTFKHNGANNKVGIYIFYVNPKANDTELFNVQGVKELGIHFGAFLNNSRVKIYIMIQGKGEVGNFTVTVSSNSPTVLLPLDQGTSYFIKVIYMPNTSGRLVIVNIPQNGTAGEGAPAIP